ncbi:MAG: hypothetical protein PHS34_09575 [Candidatus Omnitrophica bacterium]|nr:hypothetical protein [Candidatus Omnitrophota bacterium]
MIEELLANPMVGYIVAGAMIITQLVKGFVDERFYPLISFVIGAGLTFVVFGFSVSMVLPAIIVGGAGSGIYDIVKKTIINR